MRGTSAGRLKHRVQFISPDLSEQQNSFGELVESENRQVLARWVAIDPVSAREVILAGSNGLEVTHRVTMRYERWVKADYTIKFRGRTFHINSIINVEEADTELQLLCTERKP